MPTLFQAIRSWLDAVWRRATRHDFYGELQMDYRAACRDVSDAWFLIWERPKRPNQATPQGDNT